MNTQYGAWGIHQQLLKELKSYLNSQYFGRSPILRKAIDKALDEEFVLYRLPYVESTPAYKQAEGIDRADIPEWLRHFFIELADADLGVFSRPYTHQLKALEAAVRGRDLLVATGTGSGKTECFMWPMMAKLMTEARAHPETWESRGVRTIIMYPLNALVSDQLSRLRRLLGDQNGMFEHIFRKYSSDGSRRPQFGMYTGRTPYPGKTSNKHQDKQLARTLSRFVPVDPDAGDEDEHQTEHFSERYIAELTKQGRTPAKKDLARFIMLLEDGRHCTDEGDAELLTRFEMQRTPPDILITNYSMLEYMLMRPRETSIWDQTREWLEINPDQKLLFIIDEAHMYRGSSGGEVALLIRRLLSRLGIDRSRVQFVLTTASMPSDQEAVETFANALTGQKAQACSFDFFYGDRSVLPGTPAFHTPAEWLNTVDLCAFDVGDENRLREINRLTSLVWNVTFDQYEAARRWLGEHLPEIHEFRRLIELCRGSALSLTELAQELFPNLNQEKGLHCVSAILAVAPLALTSSGVLFPARMHMLFRGLKGVYACLNPDCPGACEGDGLKLGAVTLKSGIVTCPHCGHGVYELESDRRCGALFVRGFMLNNHTDTYLWPYCTYSDKQKLTEVTLYLPPKGYTPNLKKMSRCFLNTNTGYLSFDDSKRGMVNWREMYHPNRRDKAQERRDLLFSACPHCLQKMSRDNTRTFSTRGNQAFFNLVQTQFRLQPAVSDKDGDPKRLPNEGRKVLIFSDSRQRAAKLARDLSDAADSTASRQIACRVFNEFETGGEGWASMKQFYPAFAKEVLTDNIPYLSGEERSVMLDLGRAESEREARFKRRGRKPYSPAVKEETPPYGYQEQFLKLFCAPYNTLFDAALCWFEPVDDEDDPVIEAGIESGSLPFKSVEAFNEFFALWVMMCCKEGAVLSNISNNRIRTKVRPYAATGLDPEDPIPEKLAGCMNWTPRVKHEVGAFLNTHFLAQNADMSGERLRAIDISKLRPRLDLNHKWLRCPVCSELTPFAANECCPHCGARGLVRMTDEDTRALDFWRAPIEQALEEGYRIRNIYTEEHTAQLSYKDLRDDTWSKTETYELRFQDLVNEDDTPIDILSCTTTMEVGIDIGSLVAVSMRNVPPTRENYQQRAGRAGRRSASLSTILTFCEDGAHDSYYFRNPKTMLTGEPRKPWIDIENTKLVQRHLNLLILKAYVSSLDSRSGDDEGSSSRNPIHEALNLDDMPVGDFITAACPEETGPSGHETLHDFALKFDVASEIEKCDCWELDVRTVLNSLDASIGTLNRKYSLHKHFYCKMTTLEALHLEGIIPTYSFPRDVVSLYIYDHAGMKIEYQLQRSLDMAISEFAPGRSIVVDKKTYKMGGLFFPPAHGNPSNPAVPFFSDSRYSRNIIECPKCSWFGTTNDADKSDGQTPERCPFCGYFPLERRKPMIRPWGFAPENGVEIPASKVDEEYSAALTPLYSTLPQSEEEMTTPWKEGHARLAYRTNQHIIMMNRGPQAEGFQICRKCGAAAPNTSPDAVKQIKQPYPRWGKFKGQDCNHPEVIQADLGFEFMTDMLVIEIKLDPSIINVDPEDNHWIDRAGQTLAEALRLTTSNLLDIDFSELVAGFRKRKTGKTAYLDVYLYDSLSSGAGYAVSLKEMIDELMSETERFLDECDCQTSCHNCLQHFRNQFVQSNLDRHSGLDLLRWARYGTLAPDMPVGRQRELLARIEDILKSLGIEVTSDDSHIEARLGSTVRTIVVCPAMRAPPEPRPDCIFVNEAHLRFAKPTAVQTIMNGMA